MPYYTPRILQVDEISTVAAGATVIAKLPIGPRLLKLIVETGNTAIADTAAPASGAVVGEVTINLGGSIQRNFLLSEADTIYTDYGDGYASQAIVGAGNGGGRRLHTIFFEESFRKRSWDQQVLGWQTGWLKKRASGGVFQAEFKIQAGITPTLRVWAVVDDIDDGKPSPIMRWVPYDDSAVGSSLVYSLDDLEKLTQLTAFSTSDGKTITAAKLEINSKPEHNTERAINKANLLGYDMTQAAGAYHIVFDHDDNLLRALPAGSGTRKLTLTPSAAANGTIRIMQQILSLPEGVNG